jgi:CheY-like chemotaxis protein
MATNVKVLFVDDSLTFLETFSELCVVLSNQVWGIERAVSVDRALAILQTKPIDLVVLDLGMPMMDGLQLIVVLRQRHPALKIAVMTGNAVESKRAEILAAGAELFVEKPVTPAGIRSVFKQLNDLVMPWPRDAAADMARGVVVPDEEFVVVAEFDGKWNSPDEGRK